MSETTERFLGPGLSAWNDAGGRPGLLLEGAAGAVRLTLLGAHVQSWRLPDGEEVLFQSADASFEPGVATRGGVPVVFPWFGAGAEGEPAHGYARIREWRIVDAVPGESVALELPAQGRAGTSPDARLDVSVSDGLRIALTVHNDSEHTLEFEEALHTYFRVGDVKTATVHGLERVAFTEFAKAPQANTDPSAPITFEAETDRVFQGSPSELVLRAQALGREIWLTSEGSGSTVVWNPWIAKAAAMSQMRDDEWTEFVCVETANCKEGSVTLTPGETHSMGVRFRVDGL